jgi:hypothetical protein
MSSSSVVVMAYPVDDTVATTTERTLEALERENETMRQRNEALELRNAGLKASNRALLAQQATGSAHTGKGTRSCARRTTCDEARRARTAARAARARETEDPRTCQNGVCTGMNWEQAKKFIIQKHSEEYWQSWVNRVIWK